MAETKPAANQSNLKLIKNIFCVLLVAAVVLAAIAFSGRNAALDDNAALTAQVEELTASVKKLEEEAAAAQAELEAKRVQADEVLQLLMAREAEFQALLEESEKKQDTDSVEVSEVRVHKFSIWKRFCRNTTFLFLKKK